jgi:hypothetical protein
VCGNTTGQKLNGNRCNNQALHKSGRHFAGQRGCPGLAEFLQQQAGSSTCKGYKPPEQEDCPGSGRGGAQHVLHLRALMAGGRVLPLAKKSCSDKDQCQGQRQQAHRRGGVSTDPRVITFAHSSLFDAV